MNPIIVIPARMASVRLPGKPLADICGEPMIVHVWRRATEAGIGPVVVAAAEAEIAAAVEAAGGTAVLTRADHPSGSDRVCEAVEAIDQEGVFDTVINLQGDFPTLVSADLAVARVAPRQTVTLPLRLQPVKRGIYTLPELRPHSTFPFNLMRSGSVRHPLGTLTVIPQFHSLTHIDVPMGMRYQPGGVALSSHVGESPEYIGNRDYVPGESTRRLDFRGWARLARPVVREFQEEYYCRIALILDTWIPTRRVPRDGFPQLEAAISLSASIADALSATEHLIDIFAAGPELYVFRAGRQLAHFDNVLEILAAVDACRTDPFEMIAPAVSDELASITTAICVFLDWDASREHLARTIVESGCQLKLIIVRDGPTTEPLPVEHSDVTHLGLEQIQSGGIEEL